MDIRATDEDHDAFKAITGKSRNSAVFLLAFILLLSTGYTLAANINLGSASSTEFGQGVLLTSACDSVITSAPLASFKNDTLSAGLLFSGLRLSNVSSSCVDKLMVVKIYAETGTALKLNSDIPFTALKFHLGSSAWFADSAGCLAMRDAIVGSAEDNQVTVSTSGCLSDPYWKDHLTYANDVYRYTLETKENTVRKIDLNYIKGDGRTFGWIVDTGEVVMTSQMNCCTQYPLFPDLVGAKNFALFIQITTTEYSNPSSVASLFSVSTQNGTSCTYKGVTQQGDASRAPGLTGYSSPLRSAEFTCSVSANDTVTIS